MVNEANAPRLLPAISHLSGVGMDEAFKRLRSLARSNSQNLQRTAEAVINRTINI